MPGIPTLKADDASLATLRKHWMFLRVGVRSEPLAQAFVPELEAFGASFEAVAAEAQARSDGVLQARYNAVAADRVLNQLADQVSSAIHGGQKPDLDLPLHQLYFGRKRPSVVKRPILGAQLERMRPWPALLEEATQPALSALAPAVAAGVAAAEEAEKGLTAALAAEETFRIDGARRALFDAYNALAARTFGGLKAVAHKHPELRLPSGWAESFFLHESHGDGTDTVEGAAREVKRLEAALAAAREKLGRLEAARERAARAEEEAAAARAAIAAAKRETAAAKQREREVVAAAKRTRRRRG